MKKPFSWMVLLFFGASTLQHCSDPGESAVPEKVQFTCSFKEIDSGNGRVKATQVPDALYLSIETASGDPVFTGKKVSLLRMGDSFMTEPMDMLPGTYSITDFMLVTADADVLYATPRSGSPLSRAVNHPLPFRFSVTKSRVSNVNMEVIDVNAAEPEDFGYISFFINLVNPLRLAVFITSGTSTALTTAHAYILEGDDTVKQYDLRNTVNLISFPGDTQVPRKLIITKPGYNTEEKQFVYDELIGELDGHPLKITLVPAIFTIKPIVVDLFGAFRMILAGQVGNLSVDWGDGASDNYVLNDGVGLEHQYTETGDYEINITGDLDKITYLYGGSMKSVNLQGLTSLREIRMGLTSGPTVMDFSHNKLIDFILMPAVPELKTIILPENGVLRYLDITGPNQMTPADLDAVIDQMPPVPVPDHSFGHIIIMYKQINILDEMIGPPSPAALQRLRDLGWAIKPSL